MQLQLSASNALIKWLKADFPRLPHEPGKQAGVNKLNSGVHTLSWQVHLIDNRYGSRQKTLIVCEANSRFTYFIPLHSALVTPDDLSERLIIEWQFVFVEALQTSGLISRSDITTMLAKLNDIEFTPRWIKNTDLSINGHISDAMQWVTQTLADQNLESLNPELALDLAIYINSQTKSVKLGNQKQRFIPTERLLEYVQQITQAPPTNEGMSNVVPFRRK